jgi:acyl carrier protein
MKKEKIKDYRGRKLSMNRIYEILASIRPEFDFKSSNDYIEDGMLDSFDLITLVSELDSTFNISIDGMDIIPDNFKNMDTIAELVKKNGGII